MHIQLRKEQNHMARVVHFEIHADDPQRAVKFYSEVFGWQANNWGGPQEYWLVTTGPKTEPGIDGAILRRNQRVTGEGVTAFVCTVDVPSVDDTAAKITANGGTIALPKMAVPQVGWLIYGIDTEGNIFGALQSDHSAA
jgi:predicted enzyme related to lactoylglutathione lyase